MKKSQLRQLIREEIKKAYISEELEDEGTYRVYMNSDPDEPERINYEIYFGDGTKAEMIKQAKEMAYSNDPTNQYGDPILVKVTHEDDIDDVAWTNVPANEGFTKDDWDVKWKLPKDNLFNASKTIDAVNNRSNAIQDLLKLNPKALQAFNNDDEHPAMKMSYNELMRWYYPIMKESVNEVADPSALELVGALSTIIGGSLGIKFGMDLLTKIVDKALAATKYTATEILKIVKNNTAHLKAAAQEGKRAFVKKLMSLIINPTTTTSDYLDRIPKDPPFTIKRNEGTCGYDTDARTGKRFKTPGGL